MTTHDPSAESLFARYIDQRERGEAGDFDAFYAAHPARADELRQLRTDWDALQLSRFGVSGETVSIQDEQSDPQAWSSFLARLKRRSGEGSRYLPHHLVGEGAMGRIDAVFDEDLRRQLACKVLKDEPDGQGSSGRLGRFLEEAQVTAQLDHPGIVPVHELGIDGKGRVYFTMKLVKGEDLKEVLKKVQSGVDDWNKTRVLSTLLRACEALAFAHEKGVIHRDLKPSNIMVGRFGEAYVMDWGLARVLGREDHKDLRVRPAPKTSLSVVRTDRKDRDSSSPMGSDSPIVTMDGDVVGTPYYMPPEQAAGKLPDVGAHSDVYAMGAILYELIAGRAPYENPEARVSPHTVLARVLDGPPTSLSRLAGEASAELVAICDRAMEREIGARYPDMTALSRDLRAYLENRVVVAYESGAVAELRKWVKRNKGITATAAAAAVIIAVLTVWFVGNIQSERNTALIEKGRADDNAARAGSLKAEFDQLAGVVLLEEAQTSEQRLFPAWPGKTEAMEEWLAGDVAGLLALKPTLAQTLSDLEGRVLPWTEEEQQHDRTTHPRFGELEALTLRVTSLRRAQAVREGRAKAVPAALATELEAADAKGLHDFARQRVDRDHSKRDFGEEREALTAVRAALARIKSGDRSAQKPSLQDTLAWALFANGLDEQALAASRNSREDLVQAIAASRAVLSDLESELTRLETELSARRTWRFPEESQRFLYNTLSSLSEKITVFEQNEQPQVESRLSWARRIEALTLNHPNAIYSWEEARESIQAADGVQASDLYREHPIDLKPQTGLVPIGMNPVSLLWEFYHLRSAWTPDSGIDPAELPIPEHREDGSIAMSPVAGGMGIVFVLIPGRTFWMGAQKRDPEQPNHDPQAEPNEAPVHEVTLSPYFLARHELTQGQWERFTGENPSFWRSSNPELSGPMHPVERVSWEDSSHVLWRMGLRLPTEAQWEHACRAGTETPWSTGTEPASLAESANIRDATYGITFSNVTQTEEFDDGMGPPAAVGSLKGNGFGLYDMHGNVWEWCRDEYGRYDLAASPGDGKRHEQTDSRVNRGGAFNNRAVGARSASRGRSAAVPRGSYLGLRPARICH